MCLTSSRSFYNYSVFQPYQIRNLVRSCFVHDLQDREYNRVYNDYYTCTCTTFCANMFETLLCGMYIGQSERSTNEIAAHDHDRSIEIKKNKILSLVLVWPSCVVHSDFYNLHYIYQATEMYM